MSGADPTERGVMPLRRKFVWMGLAGILVVVAAWAGYFGRALYLPPETDRGKPILFTVARGTAFSMISERLASDGLIDHPRLVSLYAWVRKADRRVQAGTYRFVIGDRPYQIVERLVHGAIFKVSVTIPEGFMFREIAGILSRSAGVDSASFDALMTDQTLLRNLGVEGPSLEGYLFPDTYVIPWGMQPKEVIRLMVARMDEVFEAGLRERAEEFALNRHQVITLASIVEAETRVRDELPKVSAVYHNRLKKRMRLEADPTVAYAKDGHRGRLFYKDLEIDSPYNTYRHPGLPPGAVCSPGKAAIIATLYPDSSFHAVYFVAAGNGQHIFSTTLEEHLAAVRSVKKRAAPDSGAAAVERK